MYQAETVALLSQLYEWSKVEVSDIDESRYLLSKKLSEVSLGREHVCTLLTVIIDGVEPRQLHRTKAPTYSRE